MPMSGDKVGCPSLLGQAGALTMESKADTRLVMISSLRAKAEFQRSGPQPLVGTSQRFPSKAMVTWREREEVDRGGHVPQGVAQVLGAHPTLPGLAPDPRAVSTSQVGQIKAWPSLLRRFHMQDGARALAGLHTQWFTCGLYRCGPRWQHEWGVCLTAHPPRLQPQS